MPNLLIRLALASAACLLISTHALAASEGICSTASLINPNSIDGGISGTGAPANGGIAGTGSPVAKGGVSGTGTPLEKGGVSGTGDQVAIGGVAGTGAPIAKGGIGGTGDSVPEYALLPVDSQGDIAIMGVVTGFASICVNGEEVQYDNSTPIYDNGKKAKLANLAVGKTVMLKVDNLAGTMHARAIGLFNAVTGPVKGVNAARQQIDVMGQTVHVNQNIIRQLSTAGPDAVVSVSGYRLSDGAVVASRVDLANTSANVNTLGLVTGVAQDGFVVNGTKVSVVNKQVLEKVKVGSEVQVSGGWSDGALKANHVESQPINNIISRTDKAIMEGFVHKDAQNTMTISGTEVRSSQTDALAKQLENFKDKLVKVEMRRKSSGEWVTDKIAERRSRVYDNDTHSYGSKQEGGSSGKKEDSSGASDSSGSSGHGSSSGGSSGSSGHGSSSGGSSGSSGHGSSSGGSSGSSGHGSSSGGSSGSSGHGSSSGRSGGGSSSNSGSGKYK